MDELRDFARGIHPPILAQGGLGPAVKALTRRSAVPVALAVRLNRRLPEPLEQAAYYVISEALANTTKHAHASVVHIEVDDETAGGPAVLRICIRDDGAAAPTSAGVPASSGSRTGSRRSAACSLQTAPGAGTAVRAEIPLVDIT